MGREVQKQFFIKVPWNMRYKYMLNVEGKKYRLAGVIIISL